MSWRRCTGIGQAIMEDVVFDESGQVLSGSFMDYALPRASDLPNFHFASEPSPAQTNTLGVKGCGKQAVPVQCLL